MELETNVHVLEHKYDQACPEVRYLEDQEARGQRLLICLPEEKTPFLQWVKDVDRLSEQQLQNLLPPGGPWRDYQERLEETQNAVRCARGKCDQGHHKLPFNVEIFQDFKYSPRYASTTENSGRVIFSTPRRSPVPVT